jgi:hypothetical protein
MPNKGHSQPHLYGVAPVGISRYFALYISQIGWVGLGVFLMLNAYWPSSCRPASLVEIYSCSSRLAEGRGWVEAVLMTWLWSTPLLVGLEVSRRLQKTERR